MAGFLRPNGPLKAESLTYTINGVSKPYTTTKDNALLNGVSGSTYDKPENWYIHNTGIYIDITFAEDVNIWAYPAGDGGSWTTYYGDGVKLKVEKWNGSAWVDVTSTTTQNANHPTEWRLIFPALVAGRYKFSMGGGPRMEGEWFLEKTTGGVSTTVMWAQADKGDIVTLSNNYLTATYTTFDGTNYVGANLGKSIGKWYWEVKFDSQNGSSYCTAGVINGSTDLKQLYSNANAKGSRLAGRNGVTVGFALDLDSATRTLKTYLNNVLYETISWADSSGVVWRPALSDDNGGASLTATAKFKQSSFTYAPPSGYEAFEIQYSVYLVASNDKIYTYSGGWIDTGFSEPLTEANFKASGMKNLTSVTTPTTTILQNMVVDSTIGTGKLLRTTVDQVKYGKITGVSVL